jgi:leucyl-tRNA synthetase
MSTTIEKPKSNVKLNALLDIEKSIQTRWYSEKIFEQDADKDIEK